MAKRKKRSGREVDEIAAYVIGSLKEQGVTVQRYDSITTNSIYLKLDYGMCGSIRISDHAGKRQYDFLFNLRSDLHETDTVGRNSGEPRRFYPFRSVTAMLMDIIALRYERIKQYELAGYKYMMGKRLTDNAGKDGFWKQAKLV